MCSRSSIDITIQIMMEKKERKKNTASMMKVMEKKFLLLPLKWAEGGGKSNLNIHIYQVNTSSFKHTTLITSKCKTATTKVKLSIKNTEKSNTASKKMNNEDDYEELNDPIQTEISHAQKLKNIYTIYMEHTAWWTFNMNKWYALLKRTKWIQIEKGEKWDRVDRRTDGQTDKHQAN